MGHLAHLHSLCLEGPLCHCPDLAAAVASWRTLPGLKSLVLELAECPHSHADLAGEVYGDPDVWLADCWAPTFSQLSQLRSLALKVDSLPQVGCRGLLDALSRYYM